MLVRNLVDRLRQPPERARDLAATRRKLSAEGRTVRRAGTEERAAAIRLRALREELAREQGCLATCASCAHGHAAPEGTWEGGLCCGSATFDLFRDDEIAALCLSGTRARHLRAPPAKAAGCAFRGPTGCALPPRHRPTVCVRYFCKQARRELFQLGRLDRMEALIGEIEAAFDDFLRARRARLADEEFEDLLSG